MRPLFFLQNASKHRFVALYTGIGRLSLMSQQPRVRLEKTRKLFDEDGLEL